MHISRFCSITVALVLACCAGSRAAVLYDGSAGNAMTDQNWHYVTFPLGGASAIPSVGGGATNLDTTPVRDDLAGYFSELPLLSLPKHPGIGTLNSSAGFTVKFTVQIVSEEHSGSDDRAGFSVIVLDSNAEGVELGFWEDEIWAQTDSPLHTHSTTEKTTTTIDTTAALTEYQLAFHGSTYSLSSGGSTLFGGALKDYSAAGFIYDVSNFMFFGDNTTSASGEVSISRIELIPEPATAVMLLVGFTATMARRRKRAAA